MSDTVGFINRLPHQLIDAFRSTLEEVLEADLLIHVVDASNENYDQCIETTNQVLKELGIKDTPMIYAYNKIDLNQENRKDEIYSHNNGEVRLHPFPRQAVGRHERKTHDTARI